MSAPGRWIRLHAVLAAARAVGHTHGNGTGALAGGEG